MKDVSSSPLTKLSRPASFLSCSSCFFSPGGWSPSSSPPPWPAGLQSPVATIRSARRSPCPVSRRRPQCLSPTRPDPHLPCFSSSALLTRPISRTGVLTSSCSFSRCFFVLLAQTHWWRFGYTTTFGPFGMQRSNLTWPSSTSRCNTPPKTPCPISSIAVPRDRLTVRESDRMLPLSHVKFTLSCSASAARRGEQILGLVAYTCALSIIAGRKLLVPTPHGLPGQRFGSPRFHRRIR